MVYPPPCTTYHNRDHTPILCTLTQTTDLYHLPLYRPPPSIKNRMIDHGHHPVSYTIIQTSTLNQVPSDRPPPCIMYRMTDHFLYHVHVPYDRPLHVIIYYNTNPPHCFLFHNTDHRLVACTVHWVLMLLAINDSQFVSFNSSPNKPLVDLNIKTR